MERVTGKQLLSTYLPIIFAMIQLMLINSQKRCILQIANDNERNKAGKNWIANPVIDQPQQFKIKEA